MPERRPASLTPETTEERPRVEQWGTFDAGPGDDGRITQGGTFRITQGGSFRITQAGSS